MNNNRVSIVIPAYQPNETLPALVKQLTQLAPHCPIIIVNDGSDANCQAYFAQSEQMGALILQHEINQGKGAALKTAFNYWLNHCSDTQFGLVTADADGQHHAADILMLAEQVQQDPKALHLGVRKLSNIRIPLRSRFGNGLTKYLYNLFSRQEITDTQTGLRGLGKSFIQTMCEQTAAHYEFEFIMLLLAPKLHIPIKQHPIQTIYIDNNSSSHFHPLIDSLKIYWVFFRFFLASLSSFLIDFVIFIAIFHLTHNILPAILLARICSGIYNFFINQSLVFQSNKKWMQSVVAYSILYITNLLAIYALIHGFYAWWGNIYMAKIVSDILLFIINFMVQHFFIFRRH